MSKETIIEEMYNCIDYADLKGFKDQVAAYLSICDVSTASQDLATFLITQYTASRADTIAKLLEIIIHTNPEIALVNFPENHFFRIVMISGSTDLLDCYIEEAVEPFLENKTEEEYKSYYEKLLHLGAKLNTLFSDQYSTAIKGMDYNGAFSNENGKATMHSEDYEIMEDIVNKYNSIVGRRDVIKTLMLNSGMKF